MGWKSPEAGPAIMDCLQTAKVSMVHEAPRAPISHSITHPPLLAAPPAPAAARGAAHHSEDALSRSSSPAKGTQAGGM